MNAYWPEDRKLIAWLVLGIIGLCFVLSLGGCSSRETARAATQADQAVEAVSTDLQTGPLKAIAEDPETPAPIRDAIRVAVDKYVALLNQARESIAPAIMRLSEGEPVQVPTTPQQALADTPTFIREAQRQAVRAEIETEQYLRYRQAARLSGVLWSALGEGPWWQKLLVLISGGSLTAATAVAGIRKTIEHVKVSMAQKYFATDIAAAPTAAEQEAIKERHRKVQEEAGIHQAVVKKIKKTKPVTKEKSHVEQ